MRAPSPAPLAFLVVGILSIAGLGYSQQRGGGGVLGRTAPGGLDTTAADAAYLRLDATNDPLTGQLEISYGDPADPALIFNHGGGLFGQASGGYTMAFAKADGSIQFGTGGSLGNYFPVYMDIRGGIYDQGDGVVDFNDAIDIDNTIASGNNLWVGEGATVHFSVDHAGRVDIRHSDSATILSVGSAGSQWFAVESSSAGNVVTSLPLANDSTPCGGDVCIDTGENLVPETTKDGGLGTSSLHWEWLYVDAIYDTDNTIFFGANLDFSSGEGLSTQGTFIPVADHMELADGQAYRCASDGGCTVGDASGGMDEVYTDNLVASTADYIISQDPVQPYRSIGTTIAAPHTCVAASAGVFYYADDTDDSKPGGYCKCQCAADNGAGTVGACTWQNMDSSSVTCP